MYLAGLEKILKAGQALGLEGAELRSYFDHEYVKLRAERALNREAMRIGVDAVRLAACGEDREAIISECEKRKGAYERELASLEKQVAALESRTRPARTDGISVTSVHEEACELSRVCHALVPVTSEHRENRSLFQETACAPQDSLEQAKDSEGKRGLPVKEASLLPLTRLYKSGNCSFSVITCQANENRAGDPQKQEAPFWPTLGKYPINETVLICAGGTPTVSEICSWPQRRTRKTKNCNTFGRQLHKKTSVCRSHCIMPEPQVCRRLSSHPTARCLGEFSRKSTWKSPCDTQSQRLARCSFLRGSLSLSNMNTETTSATHIVARRASLRERAQPKNSHKRPGRRRKRMRNPQRSRKCYLFPAFQETYFPARLDEPKHFTRRYRKGFQGVFHTRGACCPKRKRRRIILGQL